MNQSQRRYLVIYLVNYNMKKLFRKLLKPFRKARKQIPRVRYVDSDGVVRYANVDKLTVRVLVERVKQLEERIV